LVCGLKARYRPIIFYANVAFANADGGELIERLADFLFDLFLRSLFLSAGRPV
jgi:hypothetical protein